MPRTRSKVQTRMKRREAPGAPIVTSNGDTIMTASPSSGSKLRGTLRSGLAAAALFLLPLADSSAWRRSACRERLDSLFNGKDLDGWKPKIRGYEAGENFGNTFRVENGVLKVVYDQYTKFDGKFGHLFYKTPYSKYKLHIEYRFVGDQCPGGPKLGPAEQRRHDSRSDPGIDGQRSGIPGLDRGPVFRR